MVITVMIRPVMETSRVELGIPCLCLLFLFFNSTTFLSIRTNHRDIASCFFFSKKKERKKKEREINIDPEDFPRFAVFDTRLPEHAIRSSVTVLCLFVSLQGQLANDDSDDEEEDAQRQDAGAQALFPHGRAHQGGGVRGGHGGHLPLPQPIVLLKNKRDRKKGQRR